MKNLLIIVLCFFYACEQHSNHQNQIVHDYLVDSNKVKLGLAKFQFDTIYYSSKKIKDIQTYIDTLADGYSLAFYETGNFKQISFFKNGIAVGLQKDFYEDGQLKYSGYFKNGTEDSVQNFFYENGVLKNHFNKREGKKIGSEYLYFENGELEKYLFWDKEGRPVYRRTYDSTENLIKEEGTPIADFGINMRLLKNDTTSFFAYCATPPRCSFNLELKEENNLVPPIGLSNLAKENKEIVIHSLIRKKGDYSFDLNYTIADSISDKKKTWTRNLKAIIN